MSIQRRTKMSIMCTASRKNKENADCAKKKKRPITAVG